MEVVRSGRVQDHQLGNIVIHNDYIFNNWYKCTYVLCQNYMNINKLFLFTGGISICMSFFWLQSRGTFRLEFLVRIHLGLENIECHVRNCEMAGPSRDQNPKVFLCVLVIYCQLTNYPQFNGLKYLFYSFCGQESRCGFWFKVSHKTAIVVLAHTAVTGESLLLRSPTHLVAGLRSLLSVVWRRGSSSLQHGSWHPLVREVTKQKPQSLCNLILEVTSHHCCCILFCQKQVIKSSPHSRGED